MGRFLDIKEFLQHLRTNEGVAILLVWAVGASAALLAKQVGALLWAILRPFLSGAFILDRYYFLPLYLRAVERAADQTQSPWLDGLRLQDVLVPVSPTTEGAGGDRVELRDVVPRLRAALITGEPGSGKTTALKSIALDCIRGRLAPCGGGRNVPIWIELRAWANSGKDLADTVLETFVRAEFPKPGRLIRGLRRAGRLVYLLDGLDEVHEAHRPRIVAAVRSLLLEEQRDGGCRVFLTSRPSSYHGQLDDLIPDRFATAEFTRAQVREFLLGRRNYRPPRSAERLFQEIADHPRILAICRNPLLLSIVSHLYIHTRYELPESREEFYKHCIDALLREWDSARELEGDRGYGFTPTLKQAFLEELAFEALSARWDALDQGRLVDSAGRFLGRKKKRNVEPDVFVEEVIRSGLLSRTPEGEVRFAHRTLAESLAASYLHRAAQDLVDLLRRDCGGWLEVASLYVADDRTKVEEIQELLQAVRAQGDRSAFLILAGEAHTCPAEQRLWVLDELRGRPEIWEELDRRAYAALARIGDDARPILTEMMAWRSVAVRNKAIHALGHSRETWAVDLVVAALTEEETRAAAVEALAGLGDEALEILSGLIAAHDGNARLLRSCIEAAAGLDAVAAIELVLPLAWHEDPAVRLAASSLVAQRLAEGPARRAFEAGEAIAWHGHEPDEPEAGTPASWAVPWLEPGHRQARSCYGKLIDNLAAPLRHAAAEDPPLRQALDRIPAVLLIPTLIHAGSDAARRLAGADARRGPERMGCPSAAVALEVAKRSDERNRALWSRARGPLRRDVEVSEIGTVYKMGFIALLLTTLPLVVAVLAGKVSPRWLTALAPTLLVVLFRPTVFPTEIEEDPGRMSLIDSIMISLTIVGLSPGVLRSLLLDRGRMGRARLGIALAAVYAPLLLGAAIAALRLGPWALAAVGLGFLTPFFLDLSRLRRSNPFLALRYALEGRAIS